MCVNLRSKGRISFPARRKESMHALQFFRGFYLLIPDKLLYNVIRLIVADTAVYDGISLQNVFETVQFLKPGGNHSGALPLYIAKQSVNRRGGFVCHAGERLQISVWSLAGILTDKYPEDLFYQESGSEGSARQSGFPCNWIKSRIYRVCFQIHCIR